ncbi:polygalacturonase QRT3-like [Vigna unguiculata]|uniref:polygalacturonase QRT3-like n=1 Tax=Vigna unguiculata TaxID=3917 RepID=UPI0010166B07|nr:polygalacturonase QRT3-like [Vigna unguiculata]
MATMSPMWFILLEITCFFVAHAYVENMSLRTLSGFTHEEAILGLKGFKASITRRHSITSTPPSYSPSPTPSPLPPRDLKKPHVYPLTSDGADPTGNSDSTEALLAAIADVAKGQLKGS